ncbi:gamma-secretase subunit Aph-1 [Galendromus occidentalis]|uniref:Gamma-secretase subunit Aph-1 n=1 Tax=Galendromus occidentalis TaxID=34638 RepID=A0AAJ6QU69_9ACAR|nr:gamma-secretase subunit Aph-1 [Galendromus occidentalis]
MGLAEFFGCSLVAFGPSLSMFCVTIAACPIRVIIFITAAFFWLVSLLFSSIVWCSVLEIFRIRTSEEKSNFVVFGLLVAVAFQELFRYLFYGILRRADNGLKKMVEVGSTGSVVSDSRQLLAYVAGLGFGTMSGGFSLLNVLAEIGGPASVGYGGQSEWFVLVSSVTTSLFVILNTCWGVILFHGYDTRDHRLIIGAIASHFVCSLMTLFNKNETYVASLLPISVMTVVCAGLAFHLAGGKYRKLHLMFKSRTSSVSSSQ